ncbi:uncharacterized protein UBRO_01575 [Ustilago bromivora]|uniref:Uncharacterized protein n=1 Tax=Ustilago bromivora TaxID=307758 RepID=A0A1K0FZB0_9BASI|nr:uncharacterized protein UBRO_01575 [Ustilago bromivora]
MRPDPPTGLSSASKISIRLKSARPWLLELCNIFSSLALQRQCIRRDASCQLCWPSDQAAARLQGRVSFVARDLLSLSRRQEHAWLTRKMRGVASSRIKRGR